MLILIATITASGCNSVQIVNSTTINTVPITNTSLYVYLLEAVLTLQQILGDISIQSAVLREDGVTRKEIQLITAEQLEKGKELWNQIKVKESSDSTVQEFDILYGEPSRIIQINDNLELYVDATLKRIYIDSKGYELIEFPRDLFNEIMGTTEVNEIAPDENLIREYYERFQRIGADNLIEEMMQKYGEILKGIE